MIDCIKVPRLGSVVFLGHSTILEEGRLRIDQALPLNVMLDQRQA